jgi:hypothetical protein
MKINYLHDPSQSEESEEQNSSKVFRGENGKELKLKSGMIQNWNNLLSGRAWFVVDRLNNKIVKGPFETSKIATCYVEEHGGLCRQCVMNGSELLKKYHIDIGRP